MGRLATMEGHRKTRVTMRLDYVQKVNNISKVNSEHH